MFLLLENNPSILIFVLSRNYKKNQKFKFQLHKPINQFREFETYIPITLSSNIDKKDLYTQHVQKQNDT